MKPKTLLALSLVFVAGLVCGVVGTRAVLRVAVHRALEQPDAFWSRWESRIARELELTPEQRPQAREALNQAAQRIQGLRNAAVRDLRTTITDLRTNLQEILTPEQQARLERLARRRPLLWGLMQAPE